MAAVFGQTFCVQMGQAGDSNIAISSLHRKIQLIPQPLNLSLTIAASSDKLCQQPVMIVGSHAVNHNGLACCLHTSGFFFLPGAHGFG
ncbi:hypothetical protein D3C76_1028140 [compost metagenome]